jgi:hypothetical protein
MEQVLFGVDKEISVCACIYICDVLDEGLSFVCIYVINVHGFDVKMDGSLCASHILACLTCLGSVIWSS